MSRVTSTTASTNTTDRHFKELNGLLLRNYIENFSRAEPGFTMNMVGSFEIEARRQLGEGDLVTSGTVLLARCVDFPDVVIEYILPGAPGSVPEDVLKVGDILDLGTKEPLALRPIQRRPPHQPGRRYRYCLCIVPIVFSQNHIARGLELELEPPESLNLEGVMPPIEVGLKVEEADPDIDDGSLDAGETTDADPPEQGSGASD